MRRIITQIGQSISDWFFTKPAQDNMVALGKLAAAVLGTTTAFNGLAVTPTSPASMQVNVGPGEIYALAALEASAFGTLPADTTHQIVKQGISLDTIQLACTAPVTSGQSINYLIQATYAEEDVSLDPSSGASPVVLQYYNADNPSQPWNGPGGLGGTSYTFRNGKVTLSAKAGIAATTGSQVTPAPDAGYVGVTVVTVANGQTTIVSGNIMAYSGAPIINSTLLGQTPAFGAPVVVPNATLSGHALNMGQADGRYLAGTVITAAGDPTYVNSSGNPASTNWVRGSMSAIATAAGFAVGLGVNGYVKFPSWLGGIVMEWGTTGSVGPTGSLSITFPLTFPSVCGAVTISRLASSSSQRADTVTSITTSSFMIGNGSPDTASVFRFFAIGY